MDVVHDPGTDVDADDFGDSADDQGRWARHLDSARRRRRLRRRLAAGLGVAGVIVIIAGLSWHPDKHNTGTTKPQPVTVNSGAVTPNTAKPPTTGPGGVGNNPQRTGLPAAQPGGRVRTGTKEQGCFNSMREYLDAWDRTGQEPDPCFVAQDPANQPQPNGVVRSYNGEKF
jgi:hypothetical protein